MIRRTSLSLALWLLVHGCADGLDQELAKQDAADGGSVNGSRAQLDGGAWAPPDGGYYRGPDGGYHTPPEGGWYMPPDGGYYTPRR